MRLSATIALPVSVSTRPRCRTGHSTMPTRVMKAKSSPTVMVPSARKMPPASSTMVICAMQNRSLMPQYRPINRFMRK